MSACRVKNEKNEETIGWDGKKRKIIDDNLKFEGVSKRLNIEQI